VRGRDTKASLGAAPGAGRQVVRDRVLGIGTFESGSASRCETAPRWRRRKSVAFASVFEPAVRSGFKEGRLESRMQAVDGRRDRTAGTVKGGGWPDRLWGCLGTRGRSRL
jgi:hypothetical protein